jgi:threonyl-tRNA synthetase
VDARTESLNKKVREAQLDNVPFIVTVGAKEKSSGTLSVRTLDGKVKYGIPTDTFVEQAVGHIRRRSLDLDLLE